MSSGGDKMDVDRRGDRRGLLLSRSGRCMMMGNGGGGCCVSLIALGPSREVLVLSRWRRRRMVRPHGMTAAPLLRSYRAGSTSLDGLGLVCTGGRC